MDGIEAFWGVLFWAALILVLLYLGPMQAHRAPGRVTQVATWLLLTILSLAYGGLLVFLVVHLLLFTLGTGVAAFGLFLSAVLLLATPVGWWIGVRAVAHRMDPHGRARG
ncbi:MAG TPA: hypothetical protein VLS28_02280 [Candidatus Sulfomarinibacteraceae bacterium]|nr:hypothetical protein [Candidatus Sulfomarinibacteraceae bacterium]